MVSPSTYARRAGPPGIGDYPHLREALDDRFASLPPEEIEQLVAEVFGPRVEAEDVENVFASIGRALGGLGSTIGNVVSQAAPYVARALPGAATGAATGAALGPLGALGGALIGGLGSLLGGPGGAPAGPAPPAAAPAPAPARPAVSPVAAITSGPAAGQLLSAIARPETLQALMAMLMGQAGRPTVPVGPQGTPVGLGAFTNLLGVLANQASAELRTLVGDSDEGVPRYLMEHAELDPAVPEHQAAALYTLFREADRAEAIEARRATRRPSLPRLEAAPDASAELQDAVALGALLGAQDVLEEEGWDETDD